MVMQTTLWSIRSYQAASAPCTDLNFILIWINIKTEAGDKTAPKKVHVLLSEQDPDLIERMQGHWHWYCLLCEYILHRTLLKLIQKRLQQKDLDLEMKVSELQT